MRRVVALLAAVSLSALTGCGGGGAEPGASQEATLVLDFTPNAVHAGIYAAEARGYFADRGIELKIQEPGATSDAPKLLAAGKADFAVMDINDLAIARQRGADLVAIAPVVDRPLASVIARRSAPANLQGATIGVTGVPSDDAVLDTVLDGLGTPTDSVRRVTIGFTAVGSLAAGKVDAATAFRNAEGVELQRRGIDVRVLPVQAYGAPRYPELVVVTTKSNLDSEPGRSAGFAEALLRGSRYARQHPAAALDDLLTANPSLKRGSQAAQLRVIASSLGGVFDTRSLLEWKTWAERNAITDAPTDTAAAFPTAPVEPGALSQSGGD